MANKHLMSMQVLQVGKMIESGSCFIAQSVCHVGSSREVTACLPKKDPLSGARVHLLAVMGLRILMAAWLPFI